MKNLLLHDNVSLATFCYPSSYSKKYNFSQPKIVSYIAMTEKRKIVLARVSTYTAPAAIVVLAVLAGYVLPVTAAHAPAGLDTSKKQGNSSLVVCITFYF